MKKFFVMLALAWGTVGAFAQNEADSVAAVNNAITLAKDCLLYTSDVSELCELASYSMVPSTYVKLRYGIEDKCSTYEWLESYLMDRDDCCICLLYTSRCV